MTKAVFVDRDGTIIVDTVYSVALDLLQPMPGAVEGLRRLQEAGYKIIVITNQSGVARGKFGEAELREFHSEMTRRFEDAGVRLSAIYYCPHYANGSVERYAVECDCRKPEPGLILRATREHDIDAARSWMIGDKDLDIEVGHAAGCKTIRVGAHAAVNAPADFNAADMRAAADIILRTGR